MSDFFAQGRLGTELINQPLNALWWIVNLSPIGDPILKGGTLNVIIKQIAKFEGREFYDVHKEVTAKLVARRHAEEPHYDASLEAKLINENNPTPFFGGALTCENLEALYVPTKER